jgi:hypothetical protein
MFKGNRKYYSVLALIFIAVIVLQYMQPKPINWTRTYFKKDKISFGCYAIFNLLENNFAKKVIINKQTLYSLNAEMAESNQTLILIDDNIELSKLDVKSLFSFLKKGNTVLICTSNFSKALKDTFNIDVKENWITKSTSIDSLLTKRAFEVHYTQPKNNVLKSYVYPTAATESYFTKFDTTLFKVSSVNKQHQPVLLEANIGKGKLILSSLPDVFGNIFIVNHVNRFYAYTLLSKVKNDIIIWDENYKTHNVQQKGIFQFIFNNDALYMGYCIAIFGLLFFMIFEMKRKQRAIPIIKPLQNSTLEFVDVISHVYFNSKNHKYIAEEKIVYFYFDVRKKFSVNTTLMNDEFYNTIHHLSGIDLDAVKKLFSYCENLKQAPSLTEQDLLELNTRITNFKLKSIR